MPLGEHYIMLSPNITLIFYKKGAMDIDLPTEIGPTEETVEALMEYLVGPLLPLKQTDITKKSLSEAQHQSVAKQVSA